MIPWVFLAVSIVGALFTFNAHFPQRRTGPLIIPSFLAGWLTSELFVHHLAWQAVATVVFVALGALDAWPGWLGLAITAASWLGLVALMPISRRAEAVLEDALVSGLGASYRDSLGGALSREPEPRPAGLLNPFAFRHPDVVVTRDIAYLEDGDDRHLLDIHHPRVRSRAAPVLLQIHGGGWMIGNKHEQGVPLMTYLAARGWVCVATNYRLSPRATFPDHIIDVKRALRWVRENIESFGGDPDFVVATGGSAGGHLASLLALTAGDPEFQPGFEEADTRVEACVPFYGVYDWTNHYDTWAQSGLERVLEKTIVKKSLEQDREFFRRASPMHRVHAGAPPFLIIHGTHDSLAPVEEARHFASLLRDASDAPVSYAEIPGAQHAFEVFHSLRTRSTVEGVSRFLAWAHARHRERTASQSVSGDPAVGSA